MTDDQTANDECGICLETLTAAVTLPCTHKFCANCLDGWKSKFGSSLKEERSKSCPLCRKKIPPSKEMIMQFDTLRKLKKREFEDKGDTSSEAYMYMINQIKELEEEIGDYDGKGLDYDDGCMDIPNEIFKALKKKNMKKVMKWLGSPVDKKKLSARYPDQVNTNLVLLATLTANSDLLSILLQSGADVNASDANGFNPLMIANTTMKNSGVGIEQAKILLEWGTKISLSSRKVSSLDEVLSVKEAFIVAIIDYGNTELANLISSEFGGRRCEVINLPNHPQLNGKACVVEKYITKKDKYKIIFEGSGNAALVGPNNLKRRDRTPLDCGYYVSFKNGRVSRREFATKEECQAYVSALGGDVKETAKELASF